VFLFLCFVYIFMPWHAPAAETPVQVDVTVLTPECHCIFRVVEGQAKGNKLGLALRTVL